MSCKAARSWTSALAVILLCLVHAKASISEDAQRLYSTMQKLHSMNKTTGARLLQSDPVRLNLGV